MGIMRKMKQEIEKLLSRAVEKLLENTEEVVFDLAEIRVDWTKDEKFGDYTSNVAMILAGKMKKNPMEIAEQLSSVISNQSSAMDALGKVEVARPGYINFYLSEKYLQDLVAKINAEKSAFGNSQIGEGVKVDSEFISANPTGPLTVGNGRGGFFGDCLSRVLRKVGFEVTNEYYVNDAGGQIIKLGHSVLKDAEAAYSGQYIDELNAKYAELGDVTTIGKIAAKEILENMIQKTALEKMKIIFDVWTSEQQLNDDGFDQRAIRMLKEKGLTFEFEGAVWLKTTQFGDDKDRVLIKKDGKNAYIAGDCGYMLNKIERGFERLILCLGADHHGYVSRLQAVAKALDFEGDFTISVSQLVRIVKDGKEVRMSKRAGNVVYMDELIEEIGHDVTRFFFLMYSPDTHLNFDLGLAKERSAKNPVFYVQYAHARIASILEKAKDGTYNMEHKTGEKQECLCEGVITRSNPGCCQTLDRHEFSSTKILAMTEFTQISKLKLLVEENELSLIRELNKFPALLEEIAGDYSVHKLPHYAIGLADKFHSFYAACKVIDEQNPELSSARLALVGAVKVVLAQTLSLIGVGAPEKM